MPTTLTEGDLPPPAAPAEEAAATTATTTDVDDNDDNSASSSADDDAEGEDEIIDIINSSLSSLLTTAQTNVNNLSTITAQKQLELTKAQEAEEEATIKLDELRDQAQQLADDDAWQSMYHRLRVWSKEKGHCNPRRNWKAKIDAEEKGTLYYRSKSIMERDDMCINTYLLCNSQYSHTHIV